MVHRELPQIVERMRWCALIAVVLLLNAADVKTTPIALQPGDAVSDVAHANGGGDYEVGGDVGHFPVDYDPRASLGMVQLTVSPLLGPAGRFTGATDDNFDLRVNRAAEDSGGWESSVAAMVAEIPEPGTFVLIATGVVLLTALATAGTRRRA